MSTNSTDMPKSLGGLGAAERLERITDQTDASASSSGIKSLGGLGAAKRLQRIKERTSPPVERSPRDPRVDEQPATARHASNSLQRSTKATRATGPAGETRVPGSVRDVISSPGRSLDTSIQHAMEDRMGDSLGDVRIHTGAKAARACQQINARAFTVGSHVAFNAGEYDPESPEGQHVLAHELAHVRQQTGGAVSMLPQENLGLEIDPDPQLEREAEETAQRVIQGEELGIQRMATTDIHVQRKDWNSGPSNAERLSTGEGPGLVEEKVDDLTTKTYRLTRDQLATLVEHVDSVDELPAYLEAADLEVASRLQDSMGSGVKGATKGWKAGSMAGSFAGPAGAVAGGLAGMPLGYVFAKKFGDTTADEIQKRLRDLLDLNTDQEFDTEQEKQDKSGWFNGLR
ncbi:DUF4157 domain-containing protein [Natrinema sp. SYSU A 869]|uniref:eCIS core domain-containing protein n=1 Tax=Natrinema sp. SYSU A 869 TaxID=2871694 RepID=UPI002107AAF3|nr:DUF4157 domain-containing protein [Natrinema sp. SYSU A 869]